MGISFGSTGIKPYAGSKEVAEAYVGSQLVYKAQKLPYHYYFLGLEDDYLISPNCELISGSSITKPSGANTFRIAIGGTGSTSTIRLNIDSSVVGLTLKLNAYSTANTTLRVNYKTASGSLLKYSTENIRTQDSLIVADTKITSNTAYIEIVQEYRPAIYLDAIRVE